MRTLESDARSARHRLLTHPSGSERAYLEAIEARLARVRALDAETLCTDRSALG